MPVKFTIKNEIEFMLERHDYTIDDIKYVLDMVGKYHDKIKYLSIEKFLTKYQKRSMSNSYGGAKFHYFAVFMNDGSVIHYSEYDGADYLKFIPSKEYTESHS